MSKPGTIALTGRLVREGAGFELRSDDGRRFALLLARTPVDLVERRVDVAGKTIGDDIIEVASLKKGQG